MTNNKDSVNDDISEVIAEYKKRLESGEAINKKQFLEEHPQLRDELEKYLEDDDFINSPNGFMTEELSPRSPKEEHHETQIYHESVNTSSLTGKNQKHQQKRDDILQGTFGRYEIEKVLGEGAMGAVYLATDTELHRQVALKVPKIQNGDNEDELLERFYREARSAATLRHRGICPVYDVGKIDETHYIAMAYISGAPLTEYVKLGKKLSLRNIAMIIRKISIALEAAHKQKIVHRDLKPANIMVDDDKEPVVMDFGLARQEHNEDVSRLTTVGTILGSPAYMSPEQVSGDIDSIGPQSDLYNLGVILYELLTGRVPFKGTVMAIIGQIISEEPEKPSTYREYIDADLEAICQKMMAKKTDDRYQSMKEVTKALTNYLKQQKKKSQSTETQVVSKEYNDFVSESFPVLNETPLKTLPLKPTPSKKQLPGNQAPTLFHKVKNCSPLTKMIAIGLLFQQVLQGSLPSLADVFLQQWHCMALLQVVVHCL